MAQGGLEVLHTLARAHGAVDAPATGGRANGRAARAARAPGEVESGELDACFRRAALHCGRDACLCKELRREGALVVAQREREA